MLTLDCRLKTNTLNLELLDETFTDAFAHVVDQRAAQSVKRFGLRIVSFAAEHDFVAVHFQAGAARQFQVELALRPLDEDFLAFDIHLELGWDRNRLFSNS